MTRSTIHGFFRDLPGGAYEYKYIVDGDWTINANEPITPINKDDPINNYVQGYHNQTHLIGVRLLFSGLESQIL
ncbi:phosphoglucan phosphatase DSP4, amyloplastic [Tanacetum coccineum]|uniref:Phosphoglucan phosphatase DSP4, amyloplastic n=1 Tax=Tanacetum coccineum TaxID=301880 RepID=A0ABQ4XNN4_9ASTR